MFPRDAFKTSEEPMKTWDAVTATTRRDAHGMQMTRESLEEAVEHNHDRYIPLLEEHDLLRPIGRCYGARVRPRDDGEFEIVTRMEVIEPTDVGFPTRDGVAFHPAPRSEWDFDVMVGDELLRDPNCGAGMADLEELLGRSPGVWGRRAVHPPDLILIALKAALTCVAAGFLAQLGADGWTALRESIGRLYAARKRPRQEQRFEMAIFLKEEGVEILLIHDAPTRESLDHLVTDGLRDLDATLPDLLRSMPGVRRVVMEYSEGALRVAYWTGDDCFPRRMRLDPRD